MSSLIKKYKNEKLLGQIYTPDFIVCKILDDIKYDNKKVLGRSILDPACGDGRFLEEVVKRILKFSDEKNIKENLECVYGYDVDKEAVEKCINNLNNLIKDLNIKVHWHISVTDSIKKYKKADLFSSDILDHKFDFIVGNPPYIRIQHLDIEMRKYIQNNYEFCQSGSTDLYIAFYELCLHMLSADGVCGFITPNTFMYTETGKQLRSSFKENQNLIQITNYGDIQLFDNATTYSAIVIFNKKVNTKFKFQKAISNNSFKEVEITFSDLQEPFWQLSTLKKEKTSSGVKLKDISSIHVGIQTLCDKGFIFKVEKIDEEFVMAETKLKGKVKMERSILRPIVKGSKLKNSKDKITEYILFPYSKTNSKTTIMKEEILKKEFPFAYNYLLSIKSELDKRDNGEPIKSAWYAFGRGQGLETSFGKKIIFSPMNAKPNFVYHENEESTFYSGYCIKFSGDYEKILPQLNSIKMEEFIAISSRDFSGGWKAYNKKIVENFEVVI